MKTLYEFIDAEKLFSYPLKYIDDHRLDDHADVSDNALSALNDRNISLKTINSKEREAYVIALVKAGRLKSSAIQSSSNSNEMVLEEAIKKASINEDNIKHYYGQDSLVTFKHDHWRNELPQEYLTDIEKQYNCIHSMKILGYI